MQEIPMDTCKWCNGSGREDGYLPCPDCEGTGYEYGKYAEQYFDRILDTVSVWHETLLEILVETFGYPEKRFIPKDVETFVMNYFSTEEEMPGKEKVRTFMLDEIGVDFFKERRPVCYGHELFDGRLFIYTSLLSPPKPIEKESTFFTSGEAEKFDFIVPSADVVPFLTHVDATHLGGGVFSFSKKAWENFPKTITLHTSLQFM